MMRVRYLFRADRNLSAYRDIVEMKPGSVRLVVPSDSARRMSWIVSVLLVVAYLSFSPWLMRVLEGPVPLLGGSPFIPLVGWVLGLLLVIFGWDRAAPRYLAGFPKEAMDLEVRGVQPFWTYQELDAVAGGQELRVAIHGSHRRVAEALRLARGRPPQLIVPSA